MAGVLLSLERFEPNREGKVDVRRKGNRREGREYVFYKVGEGNQKKKRKKEKEENNCLLSACHHHIDKLSRKYV